MAHQLPCSVPLTHPTGAIRVCSSMEIQRRDRCARAAAMKKTGCTLKIVVACCVALYFLSPGFSRMLLADSKTDLRKSVMVAEVARRNEMGGRILDEVPGTLDDLTRDYTFPTHNHNAGDGDEDPGQPDFGGTSRYRTSQQFARYTAQYGHRHLRGV